MEVHTSECKKNDMDPKKAQQPLADEDDEFEEFKADNWAQGEEEIRVRNPELWDKRWDDDSVNDTLGQQLRAQLPQVLQEMQQQQQQGQQQQQQQQQ